MSTVYGTDNGQLNLHKNNPIYSRDEQGLWKAEINYWLHKDNFANLVPAENSLIPDAYILPGITDLLELQTTDVSIKENPGYWDLKLVYTRPLSDVTGNPRKVGEKTIESRASFREIPVEEAVDTESEYARLKGEGVKTKAGFTVEYVHTEITSKSALTEAMAIDGVGKLSAPLELGSPTTDAWLKSGVNYRSSNGDNFELSQTWLYSEDLWDGVLYS